MSQKKRLIGELLVIDGLISAEQLQQALDSQTIFGGRIGTNLIELSFVTLDQFALALAKLKELPNAPADSFAEAPQELLERIPKRLCSDHSVFPLYLDNGRVLYLAMTDPQNLQLIDSLSFQLGVKIQPFSAPELRILAALERRYGIRRDVRYLSVAAEREVVETPTIVSVTGPLPAPPAASAAHNTTNSQGNAAGQAGDGTRMVAPPADGDPGMQLVYLDDVSRTDAPTRRDSSAQRAAPASSPGQQGIERAAGGAVDATPPAATSDSVPLTRAGVPDGAVLPDLDMFGDGLDRVADLDDDLDMGDFDIDVESSPRVELATVAESSEPAEACAPSPLREVQRLLRCLDAVHDTDSLARVLIEPLSPAVAATVLFAVRETQAAGVLAFGTDSDPSEGKSLVVSLALPSLLQRAADSAEVARGAALQDDTLLETISVCLGLGSRGEMVAVPIAIGDRVVSILYVQGRPDEALDDELVEALRLLSHKASARCVRLIQQRKAAAQA